MICVCLLCVCLLTCWRTKYIFKSQRTAHKRCWTKTGHWQFISGMCSNRNWSLTYNSSVEHVQTETEYVPTETGHWQFISGMCSNRNWSLTYNSSVEHVQTETEYVPTETGHWQFISGACSNRSLGLKILFCCLLHMHCVYF